MIMAVLAVNIYLPTFIQNEVLPDLILKTGLTPRQLAVRHIGLFGADMGPLRLENKFGTLEIQDVQMTYSPVSLWHKKLDTVIIIGLSMDLEWKEGRLCIAGWCCPVRWGSDSIRCRPTPGNDFESLLDSIPVSLNRSSCKKQNCASINHRTRFQFPLRWKWTPER